MHSRERIKLESLRKCEALQARHRVGSIAFPSARDLDCSCIPNKLDEIVRTYRQRGW